MKMQKATTNWKFSTFFRASLPLPLQLAQLPKPFSLICNTLQMMRGKMMTVCQDDDDHYDDCQADDDVPSWLSRKQSLSGPRRCGAIVTQTLCMHNQSREKGKKDGTRLPSPPLSCSLLSGSPSAARLAPRSKGSLWPLLSITLVIKVYGNLSLDACEFGPIGCQGDVAAAVAALMLIILPCFNKAKRWNSQFVIAHWQIWSASSTTFLVFPTAKDVLFKGIGEEHTVCSVAPYLA